MGDLAELLREAEELRRSTHVVSPSASVPPWFRIEAKAGDPKTAEVWIYDRIGSDFFDEGVSAKAFTRQINALKVDEIILHINSPGGDFFQGAAIYNALKDHPATVTAIVDGLAASAASFIAQAGDTRRMNRASQLMIHDANGVVVGNAADMAGFADTLDKVSDSVAGIYAARSGGSVEDWRTAMRAETWYTAAEAVEAGLADEAVDDEPSTPPVRNSWDLAIFNYAGRQAAPPPVMPSGTARPSTPAPEASGTRKAGAGMPLDPAKIREALGLGSGASDDEVRNALASAGIVAQQPTPPADPPQPPAPPTPPTPAPGPDGGEPEPAKARKVTNSTAEAGMAMVDVAILAELQRQARNGDEALRKLREAECDQILDDAIKAGKFPPARREHWKALWAKDPDGTKQDIANLAPGLIPTAATGYSGVSDETEQDYLYRQVYPERFAGKGA